MLILLIVQVTEHLVPSVNQTNAEQNRLLEDPNPAHSTMHYISHFYHPKTKDDIDINEEYRQIWYSFVQVNSGFHFVADVWRPPKY